MGFKKFDDEHGVAQQVAGLETGKNVQARMNFSEKAEEGVLAVEFDYYAEEGVIPNLIFRTNTENPSTGTCVLGVDPQDERMIGIPGGFGVIDAATGFSGSTNAVFDKWVHVKYAYDFDARKISVEYDGTTLAAEEPSNGDFDNLGILGIVFENSSAKDMKYWIDNLKITNKASAVVDTKTGFTEYDFENYSQTWGRYVGEVSSVEADKEHGSSLSLRIDDSANGWIY